MSLQIKNETVYVIYKNGQPYSAHGRKLVYTSKGAANGVITSDAQDEAYRLWWEQEKQRKSWRDWWQVEDTDEGKQLLDSVRTQYEIVEYGPKVR